ncbi:NuoM family protein [Thiothrix unzii]|jgi:NADH-quinone oxidoreductase subunit M|uniref:NADH-quinone oxidoreductase subunit M n=1 Tax=Thiothrix unzii TaxID=111769 RepID=A0A975FAG0_9GAMM|nr:NADH-quinone oxidoreductase subunit M [Thiothrix unzii]MDX9989089.1 NADH-quinone oxidoreductase subunit M [Thiothrix unzii]QTR54222.1 NADH-quinone oxidoreductase subunit M [Thiothrix unzii]
MFDLPILSFLIWLPIVGGLGVLIVGDRFGAKQFALGVALVTFLLSLPLYVGFNAADAGMQFVEKYLWIDTFNIHYHLGVDGLSMPLILLNTFITVLVVIAGWEVIKYRISQYMAAFLIMAGIVNGVFAALDAMLFYILFEAMLIPLFLIIGIWGGARRVYATIKFFLYTFFGSVFLLISLIYLYQLGATTEGFQASFAIADLHRLPIDRTAQILIFLSFLLAFGVKVPMWPVHTWLPDAHVEAPTGGSVILAAITLKVGGYAFLRFALPITPDAAAQLDWLVLIMSLTAVVYIGFVALVQQDMKKLVAYSSIAHMGFVTLGFFMVYYISEAVQAGNPELMLAQGINGLMAADKFDSVIMGLQGAMVQMVSHGFISAAMFLCIGVLYDRMHTRDINAYGGVANRMPQFAALYVFFAMANTGLPGTSGFVGEFMVILASFKASPWIAFLAATTLIVGAAYTLWLVKRVIFGEIRNGEVAELNDINQREFVMLALLAGAVLMLGLWPQPLTDVMDASIRQLIPQILQSKIGGCMGMSVEACRL